MKISLNKDQAREFIALQEIGDLIGLEYYWKYLCAQSTLERNHFETSIIEAAFCLNQCITEMETGAAKYNGNIDTAYREIMMELIESARKVCEYEV